MEGVSGERTRSPRARLHGRRALRLPVIFKRALPWALKHDCLNLAQSSAYSAMVALFPGLVVAGACLALLPDTAPLRMEVGGFFERVLPDGVLPLISGYFRPSSGNVHTVRALTLAAIVCLSGASSVIATLMEGLRRAQDLPSDCWTFRQRRLRALALVPLSLMPLLGATALVIFGHYLTESLAANLFPSMRSIFLLLAELARWLVALAGVVGLTALIYHMGTPKRQSWLRTLPGAVVATLVWFVTTLVFGWYVTRFANYSQVYGSLGAGIALLFWLYLVFLSVLLGAEFNAEFYREPRGVTMKTGGSDHDAPNAAA